MSSNSKGNKAAEEDWVGELLVGAVKLAGIGMFRFALRWPDTAGMLTVFMLTGMVGSCTAATTLTPTARPSRRRGSCRASSHQPRPQGGWASR